MFWLEGYESANDNIDADANPYLIDSEDYHYWQEGWWAGFYNEEPSFSYAKEELEQNEPMSVLLKENLQCLIGQLISTPLSYTIAECRKICAFYVEKIVTAIVVAFINYEVVAVKA